jgi:hypothetical protein
VITAGSDHDPPVVTPWHRNQGRDHCRPHSSVWQYWESFIGCRAWSSSADRVLCPACTAAGTRRRTSSLASLGWCDAKEEARWRRGGNEAGGNMGRMVGLSALDGLQRLGLGLFSAVPPPKFALHAFDWLPHHVRAAASSASADAHAHAHTPPNSPTLPRLALPLLIQIDPRLTGSWHHTKRLAAPAPGQLLSSSASGGGGGD